MYQYTRKSIGHQFDSGRSDPFWLSLSLSLLPVVSCCLASRMLLDGSATRRPASSSSNNNLSFVAVFTARRSATTGAMCGCLLLFVFLLSYLCLPFHLLLSRLVSSCLVLSRLVSSCLVLSRCRLLSPTRRLFVGSRSMEAVGWWCADCVASRRGMQVCFVSESERALVAGCCVFRVFRVWLFVCACVCVVWCARL